VSNELSINTNDQKSQRENTLKTEGGGGGGGGGGGENYHTKNRVKKSPARGENRTAHVKKKNSLS